MSENVAGRPATRQLCYSLVPRSCGSWEGAERHEFSTDGVVLGSWHSLLVLDLVSFAHEALFVPLAHVRVELIVAEEALAAELTERVYAALNLLLVFVVAPVAAGHGRNMDGEDVGVVQGVLMCEDFLEPYA